MQSYDGAPSNWWRQPRRDKKFMKIALGLAAKGRGKTSPNPMVGAIIVKNQKIIGTGYHRRAGMPHAEIYALKEAGPKAKGATLYVTLEPCNNYGRTPPCAPEILKSGIRRVVIATRDPNPINHNNGIKYLRKNGVKVNVGVLEDAAIKLNEAYNKFITTGLPFVTVKAAMSLDGKIATYTGNSKWISCKKSLQFVHNLRKEVDAVLVGWNTYHMDKPRFKGVKNKIFLGKRRVNLKTLLKRLAKNGIMHILIEGGGETIASAIEEKLVDRICIFIAPKIIGGRNAPTPVEGKGINQISQALRVNDMKVQQIGSDILISGCLRE